MLDLVQDGKNVCRPTARRGELNDLIIDELSMLSGEFLDPLRQNAQGAERKSPFGGIQLIACGELQLPPIENSYDRIVEFDGGRRSPQYKDCVRAHLRVALFWDAAATT